MEKSNLSVNDSNNSVQNKNEISVCDIMKGNTTKIIKKMESNIPSYVQWYSDLYAAYLHSLEDIFGTCYLAEKEFFDKLGFDQKTLESFNEFGNVITQAAISQIDVWNNFQRTDVQTQISGIKSYDQYVHRMLEYYATFLSNFNKLS